MVDLTPADITWLESTGRDVDLVRAQLERLRHARTTTRLDRACTLGDGIESLEQTQPATADAAERITSFVPASGAATRLFESLRLARDLTPTSFGDLEARWLAGDSRLDAAIAVLKGLDALALSDLLGAVEPLEVLEELVHDRWDTRPKALVPFHRSANGPRTALDEHLTEAHALGRTRRGQVRLHLTVAAEHEEAFREAIQHRRPDYPDTHLDVALSVQAPHTDTPAITPEGAIFRDGDGRPLLRAGGHGALLHNLSSADADLVLIKNIDNVVSEAHRAHVVAWRRRVIARLLELEEAVHGHLRRLAAGEGAEAALAWSHQRFGTRTLAGATTLERAVDALRRPLRVCAVVPNEGQKGGGPFWVDDGVGGCTPQIVESAQLDHNDPLQQQVWNQSTHFNPVDIAASLRDPDGVPYDLARYVDDAAWLFSHKSWHGRPLVALEHPGLWNGAMAGWNTCFVQVPSTTFHPVKTLADLLKPGHQVG